MATKKTTRTRKHKYGRNPATGELIDLQTGEAVVDGSALLKEDEALAILRVAYLLAAIEGEVSEEKADAFSRLIQDLLEDEGSCGDVQEFLQDVSDEAEKLSKLRKFYRSDRAMASAFVAQVKDDLDKLTETPVTMRSGIAAWLAICYADGVSSATEKAAIARILEVLGESGRRGSLGLSDAFLKDLEARVAGIAEMQRRIAAPDFDAGLNDTAEAAILADKDALKALILESVADDSDDYDLNCGGTPKVCCTKKRCADD